MSERKTVLGFIDEVRELPQKCTVESTKRGQYLFHLLIRFYKRRINQPVTFCPYSKDTAAGIKSVIEEHSILDTGRIYVLSNCDVSYIERLKPPAGTYILAECTGGELQVDRYSYLDRKDILRALLSVLNMKMSLRALLEGDWNAMVEFADYECVLRKAKIAGWDETQIKRHLEDADRVPILTSIKRGKFKDLFQMVEQRGEDYVYGQVQDSIVRVLRYKCLKQMGWDDERIMKKLELGRFWFKELVEQAAAITMDELESLAKELVERDRLCMMNKHLGLSLAMLSSSLRLVR